MIRTAPAVYYLVCMVSLSSCCLWNADAEGGGSGSEKAQPPEPADNSFCLVCHANFEEEELTAVHQKSGVGCETCHGPSYDHSSDEDHLIAPDTMYPKEAINSYCMTCHKSESLAQQQEHEDVLADSSGDTVCTDCHGEHHMRNRERRWDKRTRKLIWSHGKTLLQQKE